jgi:hypothetical protein
VIPKSGNRFSEKITRKKSWSGMGNSKSKSSRSSRLFRNQEKEAYAMPFQQGQSGNPAGRPRGSRNKATILLRDLLDGESTAITRKAIELAKDGDIAAIRICMERLVPPRKSDPVVFDLPRLDTAADAVAALSAVVAAVATGDLTPSEAADLTKVVDSYVLTLATAGFEERLAKLECAAGTRARPNGGHMSAAAGA